MGVCGQGFIQVLLTNIKQRNVDAYDMGKTKGNMMQGTTTLNADHFLP